jgi:hypothetical protein
MSRIASLPSFGLDLHPLETLVRDADLKVGRLGHDGRIGTPPRDQSLGANARMLLVAHAGDDDAPGRQPARRGNALGRANHRRHAALHVLRAAAVDAPVALLGLEGARHPRHPDRVDVPAKHQGASRRAPLEDADDVRAPRRRLLNVRVEAQASHLLDERARDRALAGGARHERRVYRIDGDEPLEQPQRIVHAHALYSCTLSEERHDGLVDMVTPQ